MSEVHQGDSCPACSVRADQLPSGHDYIAVLVPFVGLPTGTFGLSLTALQLCTFLNLERRYVFRQLLHDFFNQCVELALAYLRQVIVISFKYCSQPVRQYGDGDACPGLFLFQLDDRCSGWCRGEVATADA